MINWAYFMAALALTAAAPAPQNVQSFQTSQQSGQPQRVQTQTFQLQPVQYQTSRVSSPLQYQISQVQPVQYSQTYSQVPQFSTVPLGVQSFVPQQQQQPQVTSFVQQPQVASFVQQQPQVTVQQIPSTVQSFQQIPSFQVQSVPQVSTVNTIPSISVQQVSTPKPVVTQVTHHSTALPIVHATPTPTVRISSTPVSIPVTQVHHVQHVQPVHTVTHHAVPVQAVPVQPVTHTVHTVQAPAVQTVEHRVQNVNARSEGGAILRYVQDVRENGFEWAYETENGIKAQEQGELKDAGSDNEKLSVTGSYSYTDPDGRLISVQYIADEYGFRPVGDIIPEQILRSIDSQYNYAKSVPHDDTK